MLVFHLAARSYYIWRAVNVTNGGFRQGQIDRAAESLIKFAERVDTSKSGEPSCLGVITATGYGVRRKDGVNVIPIGALVP